MLFKYKNGRAYSNIRYNACDSDLYLPVEVDTEFEVKHYPFKRQIDNIKGTICIKLKFYGDSPRLYLHPEVFEYYDRYKEYPHFNGDFCILDHLPYRGFNYCKVENPPLYYSFLLVADIMRLIKNELRKMILERITNKKDRTEFSSRVVAI